jgi:hypothetical protein
MDLIIVIIIKGLPHNGIQMGSKKLGFPWVQTQTTFQPFGVNGGKNMQ